MKKIISILAAAAMLLSLAACGSTVLKLGMNCRRRALCLPSAFKCAILGVRRNETRRIAMKGEE